MAQLAATVYVTDPDTHQTVILDPGTCPEPRLAALVTNPSAWVDGKLPPGVGPDDDSGDASDNSGGADPSSSPEDTTKAAPAAKKTAARKTAATGRSRGRDAAGVGDSGD